MNVFLEAFIDKNLGDDLMIQSLVSRYPQVTFYCIGPEEYNNIDPYKRWNNLLLISRYFWRAFLDRFDAYVNIGGSVWQDYGDNLLWYQDRQRTVTQLSGENKPCFMIGNNIGPITTNAGEILFKEIMKNLNVITLRDKASYSWAAARLAPGQARLTSDVVLSLSFAKGIKDPNLIGVTIHRDVIRVEQNQQYIEGMQKLIASLLARDDKLHIRLYAFDSGIIQNDSISIAEIMENLDRPFKNVSQPLITMGISRNFSQNFQAVDTSLHRTFMLLC